MSSAPPIQLREVRKQFSLGFGVRRRVALDGITFEVQPGEIYGFLGPNGAGKTTSIKMMTSLLRPDSGEALIFGRSPAQPSARKRFGFLPESPVFYDHMTGREFLEFCGALTQVPRNLRRKQVDAMLERVGLAHAADLQIRRYSKGMTQRIGIAQAILHDPDLVILDEPMSGLDPMGRTEVRDIILDLRARGKTVFFSTHIIPDVEAICTRVGIVAKGRMVRVGSVQELLSEGTRGAFEVVAEGLPPAFAPTGVTETSAAGGRRLFLAPDARAANQLVTEVLSAQGSLVSVTPRRSSLEDLVVALLQRTGEGA